MPASDTTARACRGLGKGRAATCDGGGALQSKSLLTAPATVVAGRSQAAWSSAWWQWALAMPEADNLSVAGTQACRGDQGSPI